MKLRKLILSGFKSFADRTEFEFDDGVSCVVGPNGCGKSNIVDAVKWVLGEQSAKSLRGSEMMDVIFNGSAVRHPAGRAQVTLVFDNDPRSGGSRLNAQDGQGGNGVVSVTRRLFRSGQSEYLINNAPCRLRDIREMFMDTGIGVDAYSLIEQGKVELFLQASHDERRAIFDEAAGISKYKARKREALRKLQRVEQNLLRLNDILGEVEKRLRSIKYQAGKARNYQAYSERLKELRSLYFLAQYHDLTTQRRALQRKLDEDADALAAISTRIDQLEAAGSAAEVEAVDLERAARDLQGQIAVVGASLTTCEQRAEMLSARVAELGEQIAAAAARCEQLEAKIVEYERTVTARQAELERIEQGSAELARRHEAAQTEHDAAGLTLAQHQGRLADEKAGTIDLLRRSALLHNDIRTSAVRRESLHSQKQRIADRAEEVTVALQGLLTERAKAQARLGDIQDVLTDSQQRLDETRGAAGRIADRQQELQGELASAKEQRSALVSRMDTLREMQARCEGVGAGTRRVLAATRAGGLGAIKGMLGDLIETDLQHALVVEAALAGADQCLLARSFQELAAVREELSQVLAGSAVVEVLCPDRMGVLRDDLDVSAHRVVARVVDWVRFEPWLSPVLWRLLGRTLVVRTLGDAAAAAKAAPGGYRFVTLTGEVLEPDGRVRLGAAGRGAGVISRRSELADLESRQRQLDERIVELARQSDAFGRKREHLDRLQQSLRTVVYEANTERVESESRLNQFNERMRELQREEPLLASDMESLAEEIASTVRAEHEAEEKAAALERLNAERQREIDRLSEQIAEADRRRQELSASMTELKVALAAAEEKRRAISAVLTDLKQQRGQMEQLLSAGRSQVEQHRRRRDEAEAAGKDAREEMDRLYARQEQLNRESEELEESRRGLKEKLDEIRRLLAEKRSARNTATAAVNATRVELGEADVRIENLITRADEEMGMSLLELYPSYRHDQQRDWGAVKNEIDELRGKIERLGNVNLDAIDEQDELQKRREFLGGQLADIRQSQHKLNELVRRINRESRQLFLKTFAAIRENFHELFRKLFGGGRADILLIDPDDVLESGIEIVARPPGKELRSLLLLSGGEKTMTALALLFSIFRTRPSPFCLLDEVDAALDEANNDRFNQLVGEFVSDSQFIIISHAKRTIGMANVLYGVTMQEAGVSKRISVRFEEKDRTDVAYAEQADEQLLGV